MANKEKGQVFTPKWIVKKMLALCDIDDITKIKIIDNSCGDGAFICEIVKQIIELQPNNLKSILENNIVGIELDTFAYNKCLANLKDLEQKYNLTNITWNIRNANALKVYQEYENQFDLVIGNPPYVRIHNVIDDLSKFEFCNCGMTDLYLAFYEIGLKMLNNHGKLCFINPCSLFSSKASSILRKTIIDKTLLTKLVNFKHTQLFEKITTYSTILLLNKDNQILQIDYYENDFDVCTKLSYSDFNINGCWYFDKSIQKLRLLKQILTFNRLEQFQVKNGIATLCDKVLINDNIPESPFSAKVIKCSTLKQSKTLFLYDKNYQPLPFEKIPKQIKEYLLRHESLLKNRNLDNKNLWWTYGRTQGIKDKNAMKICFNNTIKDLNSVKVKYLDKGILVYSGLYLTVDNQKDASLILSLIKHQNFVDYVSLLGKYKLGGYYSFNSLDLSNYLNYYAWKYKYEIWTQIQLSYCQRITLYQVMRELIKFVFIDSN